MTEFRSTADYIDKLREALGDALGEWKSWEIDQRGEHGPAIDRINVIKELLDTPIPEAAFVTFDQVCANKLADEVAVLVKRKVIDARSPAADALLDFRNPPSSERADRIADLEQRRDLLLATIRKLSAETPYPDEAGNAAVLIAEVGTLKSRVRELEEADVIATLRRYFEVSEIHEMSHEQWEELTALAVKLRALTGLPPAAVTTKEEGT